MLTDLSAAERFEALGGGLGGPDSRAGMLGEVGAVGGDVGHDDGGVNRSLFRTTVAASMRGESGRETTILGMLGSLSFSTSKMLEYQPGYRYKIGSQTKNVVSPAKQNVTWIILNCSFPLELLPLVSYLCTSSKVMYIFCTKCFGGLI